MSLPKFVIEKFANGWTIIVTINDGNPHDKIYEYIATHINELHNIIECVNDGNYKLETDYESE